MSFLNATSLKDTTSNSFFSTDTFTLVKKEQPEIRPDFDLLDTEEQTRYQRYLSPQKRLEFLTGRTFLKRVLAEYLDIPPPSILLSLTATGKPYLGPVVGTNLPFFNLSHAAGHYLIGLSNHPIGVDIEPYRSIDLTRFRHFISPDEFEQLMELPENERSTLFFRLFTAREAFLKATDKRWSLDAIQFQLKNQDWHLTAPKNTFQFAQTDYEGCCITVCTDC
ncbi:hypothetical protein GCM10028805_37330 [Spirosoma harenae]